VAPGTSSSGSTASKGDITIASDLPTSGADASSGLPAQNGVSFAVTSKKTIEGFTLKFKPFDDTVNGVHDPQKGAQNVQQMLSDNSIMGMVGPFNSNVARAEIPVANQGALAMVSPSNTNECLTQTFDYCNPKPAALRPTGKNNYFRLAAPDTFQGPAMADYAYDTPEDHQGCGLLRQRDLRQAGCRQLRQRVQEEGRHGRQAPGLRLEVDQRLQAIPDHGQGRGRSGHLRRRHLGHQGLHPAFADGLDLHHRHLLHGS